MSSQAAGLLSTTASSGPSPGHSPGRGPGPGPGPGPKSHKFTGEPGAAVYQFEALRVHAMVRRAALVAWRSLGPHLSEAVYQRALCVELQACMWGPAATAGAGGPFPVVMEQIRPILYRSVCVGYHRLDLVLGRAILEIKSQHKRFSSAQAYQAQVRRYMFHRNPGEFLVLVVFHPSGVHTELHV